MLTIQNLTKIFDNRQVVSSVSFSVGEEEIFALVGPSGCGKTTILRLIAGLEQADSGRIDLMGNCLSEKKHVVPPEKRNIGFVFQDYALFPHLTVIENVAFGLKNLPKTKRIKKAEDLLEMVQLSDMRHRRTHDLSGGEQQRVALVRSIAPNPKLILLDEPFSSLDAELRESTRLEVHQLLRSVNMSAILVTHDQEEALSFSDQLAVMSEGRIEQIGPPEPIYRSPKTYFVSNFLGKSNIIDGIANGCQVKTKFGYLQITAESFGPVHVSIRPEHFVMKKPNGGYVGTICKRDFKGHDITYQVEFEEYHCFVQTPYDCPFQVGQHVELQAIEAAVVIPKGKVSG